MARTTPPQSKSDNRKKLASQVRNVSKKKPPERTKKELCEKDLVPSGSTLLNLACSDTPEGAFLLGGIVTIPGASSAGKTILALTALAECSMLDRFQKYELILDDAEERLSFDLPYLFGKRVAERIIQPRLGCSDTIQKFEANQLTLLKAHQPFIYVLDSFDSLSSDEELEKEMRKALAMAKSEEAAKKIAGSYNTEKAKIAGQTLRMINNSLKKSQSLLIMIQQRRQKFNAGPFSDPWTTAGGEAPFFYSNHQIWLDKVGSIKKKDRAIGIETRARVKKNSITGKLRDADFDIFYDYGVDNIGSCVDFMTLEKFWKKKGAIISADELDFCGERADLIDYIEDRNLEEEMIQAVGKAWLTIEEELRLHRKSKY